MGHYKLNAEMIINGLRMRLGKSGEEEEEEEEKILCGPGRKS
jgi:hypothetical protein